MLKTVYIGIDPAYRADGSAIAIFDPQTTLYNPQTTLYLATFNNYSTLLQFLHKLATNKRVSNKIFFIENANLQKESFRKGEQTTAEAFRYGCCVGKCQIVSELLSANCSLFFPLDTVKEISPRQKGKFKNENELLQHAQKLGLIFHYSFLENSTFKRLTPDLLDAAKLAFMAYESELLF